MNIMRKFLALAVPVLVLAFVLAKIGVNQEAKNAEQQAASEQQAQSTDQSGQNPASEELAANDQQNPAAGEAADQAAGEQDAAATTEGEQPQEGAAAAATGSESSAAQPQDAAAQAEQQASAETPAAGENIPAISEEELIALFKDTTNNLVVLDTRSQEQFDEARLIGSVNAPEGNIAKDALRNVLGEQASVVILCNTANCDAAKKISATAQEAQIDKNKFRTFTTENLESLKAKGLTVNSGENAEASTRS
jgi:rhodanese-related sulfurtransferase